MINFSGGRSSAYMLYHILDHYDGALPEDTHVCFTNTGGEREETLEFVKECGGRWGVVVNWLEYRHRPEVSGGINDRKHTWEVVDFDSASRKFEPFLAVILAKAMLPNVATRFCTSELKVRPVKRWMRDVHGFGGPQFRNALGIRYDEPRRWGRALYEECRSFYPMAMAKVTVSDVMYFWSEQEFDLQLTQDEGNCTLCFLKGRAKLVRLIRKDPDLAEWWIKMETVLPKLPQWDARRLKKKEMAHFSKRHTYAELLDEALNGPAQGALPLPDEPEVSCFCGD